MTEQEWLAAVGLLTYRQYSAGEGALLARLTLARVFDELQTPWNRYTSIHTTDSAGRVELPADTRQPIIVLDGKRALIRTTDIGAASLHSAMRTGRAATWYPVTGVTPGRVAIAVAPLVESLVLDLHWYGAPGVADRWALSERFPALHLWAGAIEGFQLQGDEQGRERALRQFAVELDRANDLSENFGHEGGAQQGAL